jgi:hypothetical protein
VGAAGAYEDDEDDEKLRRTRPSLLWPKRISGKRVGRSTLHQAPLCRFVVLLERCPE